MSEQVLRSTRIRATNPRLRTASTRPGLCPSDRGAPPSPRRPVASSPHHAPMSRRAGTPPRPRPARSATSSLEVETGGVFVQVSSGTGLPCGFCAAAGISHQAVLDGVVDQRVGQHALEGVALDHTGGEGQVGNRGRHPGTARREPGHVVSARHLGAVRADRFFRPAVSVEEADHQGSGEACEPDVQPQTVGLRNEHDDSDETSDPRRNLKRRSEGASGDAKTCRAHRMSVGSIETSHAWSSGTKGDCKRRAQFSCSASPVVERGRVPRSGLSRMVAGPPFEAPMTHSPERKWRSPATGTWEGPRGPRNVLLR